MATMIKVRALRMGIYKGRAHNPGDVFEVDDKFFANINDADAHHATFGWMEKVDESKDKEAYEKQKASEKKTAEEEAKQREKAEESKGQLPHQKTRDLAKEAQDKLDRETSPEKGAYTPKTETKEEREKREWLENEKKSKSKEK